MTLSLRTYFKVLPGTLDIEGRDRVQPDVNLEGSVEVSQVSQIECSPNRFQILGVGNLAQINSSRPPSQDDLVDLAKRVSTSYQLELENKERQGKYGKYSSRWQSPQVQGSVEESLSQSIAGMIRDLAVEVRGTFEILNSNQKEIRDLCKALGQKIDDLEERMAALEKEVNDLRRAMDENREAIQHLKTGKEKDQLKLELMENILRRNNLRFLKVPEGLEGGDLRGLVIRLIKQGVQVDDTEEDIAKDIQRAHRDPLKKNPNRDKPRKILVCFHTYAIKERMLRINSRQVQRSLSKCPYNIL
ncbi:hypothetical protein NDU88_005019 [Pleurodeles waltl]|uniref:Uncharacterized protein n=1 Tax=Pleurodeles waltl TaxID=8319 RepID=A0AAV7TSV9_PLEWA|nr:hypothetical protein NDU88_005019 [Pleurodeles waltl]